MRQYFGGDEEDLSRIYSPLTYEVFGINLKPRKGNLHVLTMGIRDGYIYDAIKEEGTVLDELLEVMQADGYQVVDLKSECLYNKGEFKGIKDIIIYK